MPLITFFSIQFEIPPCFPLMWRLYQHSKLGDFLNHKFFCFRNYFQLEILVNLEFFSIANYFQSGMLFNFKFFSIRNYSIVPFNVTALSTFSLCSSSSWDLIVLSHRRWVSNLLKMIKIGVYFFKQCSVN